MPHRIEFGCLIYSSYWTRTLRKFRYHYHCRLDCAVWRYRSIHLWLRLSLWQSYAFFIENFHYWKLIELNCLIDWESKEKYKWLRNYLIGKVSNFNYSSLIEYRLIKYCFPILSHIWIPIYYANKQSNGATSLTLTVHASMNAYKSSCGWIWKCNFFKDQQKKDVT